MSLKRQITNFFWPWHGFRKLFLKSNSYIRETGWLNSLKKGYPCDKAGNMLPWMNYAIINFLNKRLHKDLTLFEYGSGYSTMFYAGLVAQVTSLEYDQEWLEKMKDMVPDNVELLYIKNDIDGDYCRAIETTNKKFDVVIVDGRDRVNCVKVGLHHLSDRGVLVLDDSHREKYAAAIEYAVSQGFRVLDFEGMKPTKYAIDKSTLFYRPDNCLGL